MAVDYFLPEAFETQVLKTPNRFSVKFQSELLTYQSLKEKTDKLAAYLQTLDVKANTIVAILLDRSIEMVVAMLGILKSGAAYLPIDPSIPRERIRYMLQDSQCPIIVTSNILSEKIPSVAVQTILIDIDWPEIDQSPKWLQPQFSPTDLAYVIYTSGSTGKPKGVCVSHRAIGNFIRFMAINFQFNATDRFLQFVSYAFDGSVWDFFAPLSCGAMLILSPFQAEKDVTQIAEIAKKEQITVIQFSPLQFQAYAELGHPKDSSPLRIIFIGGDVLNRQAVNTLYKKNQPVQIINFYGPTEATVAATYFDCKTFERFPIVPIGKPIDQVDVYVLDETFQPVQNGEIGELHIGGIGLARGYLNQEALTREKFVENPFLSGAQRQALKLKGFETRLYKTGDLVRQFPDGNLEFIGRKDNQVKVRGFRIELDEIDQSIRSFSGIKDSVTVVKKDERSGDTLIAYLQLQSSTTLDPSALRAFLADHLPNYMIPSMFLAVERFPLTLSGKIDRLALTQAGQAIPLKSTDYEPPKTAREKQLVKMWAEVLACPIDSIGRRDSFFEIGGHSLAAMQLVARINAAFHVRFSVRDFFESPTIEGCSKRLDDLLKSTRSKKLPLLIPTHRQQTIPLSFSQRRLWYVAQLAPESPFYNIALLYQLEGVLNVSAFRKAIFEIIERHEVLRTQLKMQDGQLTQEVIPINSLPFNIELEDFSSLLADEESQLEKAKQSLHDTASKPFDLTKAPLVRIRLLKIAYNTYLFLICQHHIITDGWSMDIFNRELNTLYLEGLTALPKLPVQYKDFTIWQRKCLSDSFLKKQIDYWQDQLRDLPELTLPTDVPRSHRSCFVGGKLHFTIDQSLCRSLEGLAKRLDTTLFIVLLSAFDVLLSKYSGQEDIVIGTPVANRQHPVLENLMGFFANMLVLRSDLSDDPTFLSLVGQNKKMTLDAYCNQDVPFEQLVKELQPERCTGRNPFFQAVLTLEPYHISSLQLSGLQIIEKQLDIHSSIFDLTLVLEKKGETLSGVVEYNSALFKADSIHRLIGHFKIILQAVITHPQQKISEIPLLTENEISQLIRTEIAEKSSQVLPTITQRFEDQVRKTPHKTAIIFMGETLTYEELNQRANQLALALRSSYRQAMEVEIVPDCLIGLCVDRGLDTVIGILGILKAGGAYVPIDPISPVERFRFILEDAQIKFIVTQTAVTKKFKSILQNDPSGKNTLYPLLIDETYSQDTNVDNLCLEHYPSQLAYVIYTSGSTGEPKGVMVEHQQVIGLLNTSQSIFHFNEEDVWTLFHSYAFDFSVWEIFGSLLNGGKLVVVPSWINCSTIEFCELLEKERVTVLNQTPSAFYTLSKIMQEQMSRPLPLKFIIFGGETLEVNKLRPLFPRLHTSKTRLINMYGITETTVHVTYHEITLRGMGLDLGSPIGKTLPGIKTYLLNKYQQLVPVGVEGEIYVGGSGVARGYLNREKLTKERFISNPFRSDKKDRLYKTGDWAKQDSDGNLIYLGRIDDQVKIRGYRIELGEIEHCLMTHSEIQSATVLVKTNPRTEERYLAAYVIPRVNPRGLTYPSAGTDPSLFGVNSRYTGKPFSKDEMSEWVSQSVERILMLQPRRVLEIGCGTGLLLFQVAPHVDVYCGTDFSRDALGHIEKHLSKHQLQHVKLVHRSAREMAPDDYQQYDVVVLHSVMQYFPGLAYLFQALECAMQCVAPGGYLYLGDLRNFDWLELFHQSLQLSRAKPETTLEAWKTQVAQAVSHEKELLLSPRLFEQLRLLYPAISSIDIQLRRGKHSNEMTDFRYDVILGINHANPSRVRPSRDWAWNGGSLERIEEMISHLQAPESLGVYQIPNQRLAKHLDAVEAFELSKTSVREKGLAIDPEAMFLMAEKYQLNARISSSLRDPYCFDVIFYQPDKHDRFPFFQNPFAEIPKKLPDNFSQYANHPIQTRLHQNFALELKRYLRDRLPDYLIPSTVTFLEKFPTTSNGKLNKKALTQLTNSLNQTTYAPPKTALEKSLQSIWISLLNEDPISTLDNFFDLGGHSLLAIQLILKIKEQLNITLSLRDILNAPTIASLAKWIEKQ